MTCSSCPNCGYDLKQLDQLTLGDLDILHGGATIRWKGETVSLRAAERLMVCAIARAEGALVTNEGLAGATGYDGDRAANINAVRLCRIKKAFRTIDQDFDMFDTGQPSGRAPGRHSRRYRRGVRWRLDTSLTRAEGN